MKPEVIFPYLYSDYIGEYPAFHPVCDVETDPLISISCVLCAGQ